MLHSHTLPPKAKAKILKLKFLKGIVNLEEESEILRWGKIDLRLVDLSSTQVRVYILFLLFK